MNEKIISPSHERFLVSQLKDHDPQEAWCTLVYGGYGSGKTFFCGTMNPNKGIFINIGQGILALKSPLFKNMYPDAGNLIVIDVMEHMKDGVVTEARGFDIVCEIIEYCFAKIIDSEDWTIALDDATFLRRMIMNKVREMNVEVAANSNKKAEQSKFEKAMNRWAPDGVKDMGKEMDVIEWFIAQHIPRFKATKTNFIMTAHQREVYGKAPAIGDERPLLKVRPGFRGQTFPDQVPIYFDDVFRTKVKSGGKLGKIFTLVTTSGESEATKNRNGGVFPEVISNPNHQQMLEAIRAGKLHREWQDKLARR